MWYVCTRWVCVYAVYAVLGYTRVLSLGYKEYMYTLSSALYRGIHCVVGDTRHSLHASITSYILDDVQAELLSMLCMCATCVLRRTS